MAAALFDVAAQGVPEPVSVCSAGLLAGGRRVPPEVVATMATFGVDVSGHRSTQLAAPLVHAADVILGMERHHAREVVLLDPAAWNRTFTLKELVRRGDGVGPRSPGQPLAQWLARVHAGRQRIHLVGRWPDDEVADPLGGPPEAYLSTARELGAAVDRLAALLWPGRAPQRTTE